MNIQQLEYIIAVDRFKNFTKAAEYCNVTQATLSAMVKKLEEELEVILFDRKCNPIITTDIGLQILQEAVVITDHSRILRTKAKIEKIEIRGQIKIGIIPTIANSLLPKVIKPLIETYPNLHLDIIEITTFNIIKQLKDGTIDLGILATPMNNDDMEEEILYYETLLVYGQVNKKKKYLIPDEIKNHKIWLLEEGHCLREQFLQLCSLKKKELMPKNLSFEANSFDTLLNLVDEFGGLTLIPELYYQTLSVERQKKVSFFNAPFPVREISLSYYRPYAKKHIIDAIATIIKEQIQKTLIFNNQKNKDFDIVKI
jgi:LysR family transcriptional regulator, hydrogen peroxide-inducible genes activator